MGRTFAGLNPAGAAIKEKSMIEMNIKIQTPEKEVAMQQLKHILSTVKDNKKFNEEGSWVELTYDKGGMFITKTPTKINWNNGAE